MWEGGAAKKALQLCATGERAVLPRPMLQLAANVAKKRGSAWDEREKAGRGRHAALSSCQTADRRSDSVSYVLSNCVVGKNILSL